MRRVRAEDIFSHILVYICILWTKSYWHEEILKDAKFACVNCMNKIWKNAWLNVEVQVWSKNLFQCKPDASPEFPILIKTFYINMYIYLLVLTTFSWKVCEAKWVVTHHSIQHLTCSQWGNQCKNQRVNNFLYTVVVYSWVK